MRARAVPRLQRIICAGAIARVCGGQLTEDGGESGERVAECGEPEPGEVDPMLLGRRVALWGSPVSRTRGRPLLMASMNCMPFRCIELRRNDCHLRHRATLFAALTVVGILLYVHVCVHVCVSLCVH